jgi:glutamate-1-semialdehyde 2,1-aminomutase
MSQLNLDELRRNLYDRTQGSRCLFERARSFLPGGTARGATALQPYPLYGHRAQGAVLTDVDGNEFVDFNLEGGSCIFGHCAAQVTERVKKQLDTAEVMSMASRWEVELAERIPSFLPCVEMMRFVNSGSEACAIAARLARAFTGKPLIAMFEGHHHGQLDALLFSHYGPPLGPCQSPTTVCDSLGMQRGSEEAVLTLPFNNAAASTALIRAHAPNLAAVFLEPLTIFGGAIPAEADFVRAIRQITTEFGILMVVDEVPGGVRVGRGGAIGALGVTPDLFITGKALGGGLPIGMFGGRRDILEPLLAPPYDRQHKVLSSGTFSGNPMVMSACLATLDALESGEVHRSINRLGEEVRSELRDVGRVLGVPIQVTGAYSIFGIHFAEGPVRDVRQSAHPEWRSDFALVMMTNGILWPAGRIAGFLSTAHTQEHLERLVISCRQALELLFK